MKNKRGAMEIVLLVFLVLLVVSVALFSFIVNPSYAKVNVYDARFIENVYQKQELAEFYIRQVGEKAIVRKIGEDFGGKFKEEFSKYDFTEDYLIELKEIISEDKFMISTGAETLKIVIDNWKIEESAPKGVPYDSQDGTSEGKKIQITYTPEISVKFNLKN